MMAVRNFEMGVTLMLKGPQSLHRYRPLNKMMFLSKVSSLYDVEQ
jgi:hypothetical protein